jgi:sterol desaturase/sphingolipid hydroxylase (fatty acid hydroxylase superfamily)
MKTCPFCAESIKVAALVCPRCQRTQAMPPNPFNRLTLALIGLFVLLMAGLSALAMVVNP